MIAMRDFVVRHAHPHRDAVQRPGREGPAGQSQPLHNWRLKEYAAHHRDSDIYALRAQRTVHRPCSDQIPPYAGHARGRLAALGVIMANARVGDADLVFPAGRRQRYQKSFARFANVFPDTFLVTERGRYLPDDSVDKGRLLSAGYHKRRWAITATIRR